MNVISNWLVNILLGVIEWSINGFMGAFNASLTILATEAAVTPIEFNAAIVNTLRAISDTAIMPIAGLIITYIFCYELISMLTERNNMAEFELKALFSLIMKTTIAILLITNCFDIALAFFDVGQTLVNNAIGAAPPEFVIDIMAELEAEIDGRVGTAIAVMFFSIIAWFIGLVACGLIYLVAWSRIVMILLYISAAPIPFATLMGKDWIGQIGQNYLKNLMALALQGFLMVVVMIIYGGLVGNVAGVIAGQGAIMGVILLLVCMFVCVKTLMSCLSVAKSIFGAQ